MWNHRRRILQHQFTQSSPDHPTLTEPDGNNQQSKSDEIVEGLITEDLQFLVPLLLRFPKCYWIWNYRLWLLQQTSRILPAAKARQFWTDELGLIGKMLARDSRNFLGWGYRRTVITELESKALNPDTSTTSLVKEEFDYTTRMIETNMSNFSAWHNRSKLIPRLLDESKADDQERRRMLDKALYVDPYDQSLWFYHQYLMCTFDPQLSSNTMAPNLTYEERLEYISTEIDKVVEMLEGAEKCKWIFQSLIQLCLTYKAIASHWPLQAKELRNWMIELEKLDPLRKGRWTDVVRTLQI
ncbi:MAG: hypothetical protein Q9187_001843 [Circinaria calcarea]